MDFFTGGNGEELKNFVSCSFLLKEVSLRSWRPFDGVYPERSRGAQDMLGAIKFVEVVLLNIGKGRSHEDNQAMATNFA